MLCGYPVSFVLHILRGVLSCVIIRIPFVLHTLVGVISCLSIGIFFSSTYFSRQLYGNTYSFCLIYFRMHNQHCGNKYTA